jgi:peptide/nickel transport system substrate-binding protein
MSPELADEEGKVGRGYKTSGAKRDVGTKGVTDIMKLKTLALAGAVALAATASAQAKDLKFAFQGDLSSADPYSLNETFTLGYLANVYEGLVRRNHDMSVEPALAESWEVVEPTRWRFKLRKGVKFHDGRDFNADDVLFSAMRVRADGSDLKTRIAGDTKVVKVDDYTVDFITSVPNPILHSEWATWTIMSKGWTEENKAVNPQKVTEDQENFATRHANGTGPFILESQQADVKTVSVVNPNWWDKKTHNLDRVIFTPIPSDATRVAALLSGDVDMAYPIPVQDMKRVDGNDGTSMLVGPELRTIFLGFDQFRDEILRSDVKGKNPFKDVRVREAFFRAVNIEAIKKIIMRGLSDPSAIMISPKLFDNSGSFERASFDPAKSKALLAEAGYPNGFTLEMDCPNNRYVNDEAICQAIVGMLAKVCVKVNLLAQPKAIYFKKILAPSIDTSFYLLGWTPGSLDSYNVLYNLINCMDDSGKGKFNIGRYCNAKVDELTKQVLVETDKPKRDGLIEQAFKIVQDEWGYMPLHQQAVAWGVSDKISLKQRPDNVFRWRHVMVK